MLKVGKWFNFLFKKSSCRPNKTYLWAALSQRTFWLWSNCGLCSPSLPTIRNTFAHKKTKGMHSHVISVWWASGLAHDQPRDQCNINHVISAWLARWTVQDQPSDQCMHSHIISVWSASCSVHDEPRDQCMISHVIIACSATWSVHGQPRDQFIIRQVMTAWSVTW